jgi:hypothetical protein
MASAIVSRSRRKDSGFLLISTALTSLGSGFVGRSSSTIDQQTAMHSLQIRAVCILLEMTFRTSVWLLLQNEQRSPPSFCLRIASC